MSYKKVGLPLISQKPESLDFPSFQNFDKNDLEVDRLLQRLLLILCHFYMIFMLQKYPQTNVL